MATTLSVEDLLDAYRTMKTIREFEDRVHVEFAKGGIPGFVHLYAGEEASATGVGMHIKESDKLASNHRGHGHCIAKGVEVNEICLSPAGADAIDGDAMPCQVYCQLFGQPRQPGKRKGNQDKPGHLVKVKLGSAPLGKFDRPVFFCRG